MRVHKDARHLYRKLQQVDGVEFKPRGGHAIDVYWNGAKVTTLPAQRSRPQPQSVMRSIERELESSGIFATNRPRTAVERAFREAAHEAGHREQEKPPPNEDAPEPGNGAGVIRPRRRSHTPKAAQPVGGRYFSQAEWAGRVRHSLKRHLGDFETQIELVEFGIEVAKDRGLEPPGRRFKAGTEWEPRRIAHILSNIMRGMSSSSKSLRFFEALVDELERKPRRLDLTQDEPHTPPAGLDERTHLSDLNDWTGFNRDVGAGPVDEEGRPIEREADEEPSVPHGNQDLRDQYASLLIAKLGNEDPDPALLDRIERALGIRKEG